MKTFLFVLLAFSEQSECDFGQNVIGKYTRELKSSENSVFTATVTQKKGKYENEIGL